MASNPTIHDALLAAGLEPAKPLDLAGGGRLQRFRVAGDKPGSRNGWIVFRDDGACASASFGSWRLGQVHHWTARRWTDLNKKERADIKQARTEAESKRATSQAAIYQEAAARAVTLLRASVAAKADHPYLLRKKVKAYGIRQGGNILLIPVRNAQDEVQSLQFIHADGSKMFLSGGRIAGGFYLIGRPSVKMLLAEGFATAATLHQATGEAVAVCFSAGNMQAVAAALRRKFPGLEFVLCADNDANTPGNPGLRAAVAAARSVGGKVAVPRRWGDAPCQ